MSEKWAVVMNHTDWSGCDSVHGIFDSEDAALAWVRAYAWRQAYMQAKRIRKAPVEAWA